MPMRSVWWCLDAPCCFDGPASPPSDVSSASNFQTLISAVWPSSDEACLRRRLKVIGWISDTDISLSSGITEATSAAAGTGGPHAHRQTPSEVHTTHQTWLPGLSKHPFEVLFSLFSFYAFNEKKYLLFCFLLSPAGCRLHAVLMASCALVRPSLNFPVLF